MKKLIYLGLVFLLVNFGSLAFGSYLMNDGPVSAWYLNLNKAPWTPPGWVFGLAWSIIMLCFSIYLAFLFKNRFSQKLVLLYIIQVILNVSWNYIFFNRHLITTGFVVLLLLTVLIFYFFFRFRNMELKRYLLLPYMVWLGIAASLNLYVLLYN